jgi:hypothetical protein
LQEAVKVILLAPATSQIVVVQRSSEDVNYDGVLPAGEVDDEAGRLAGVQPGGAVGGLGQPEAPAGGPDGGRVVDLGLDGDDV